MKKIILSSFIMMVLFAGCKKSSNTDTNNSNSSIVGTMTCKVNGNTWNAVSNINIGQLASTLGLYFTGLDSGFVIKGYHYNSSVLKDYTLVNIYLGHFKAMPGTYNLTAAGSFGQYAVSIDSIYSTQQAPNIGTATITKFDKVGKRISGTFSFKSIQTYPNASSKTVNITEGSFTDVKWDYSN